MYENMDVANYIIFKCNELGIEVNNLKLQKLLYYANMYSLYKTESALTKERFQKWKFGPVSPKVYFTFRHLGKHNIQEPVSSIELDKAGHLRIKEFDENTIADKDKNNIDKIIKDMGSIGRFDLVDITHKEPMWRNFEDQILNEVRNLEYSDEEIISYVNSLSEESLPWKI